MVSLLKALQVGPEMLFKRGVVHDNAALNRGSIDDESDISTHAHADSEENTVFHWVRNWILLVKP